jgi:hypothetical protein
MMAGLFDTRMSDWLATRIGGYIEMRLGGDFNAIIQEG